MTGLRVPATRDHTYCWDAIFAGEISSEGWNRLRVRGRKDLGSGQEIVFVVTPGKIGLGRLNRLIDLTERLM